jgi:Tol biopolymer transport system component/DNA-binding winged helix-turn-helix (wHTH) protein
MATAMFSPRFIRFGIYEADLQSGELRKGTLKLKLSGQPFQVLAILLEHSGEVVTREELHMRLWPGTLVDVDHNLNTAINKIREVLGDSAENPRFVETLPRRGYRFIAHVDVLGQDPTAHREQERPPLRLQSDGEQVVRKLPWHRYWILSLSCAAIIVIAVLLYWIARPLLPPKVSAYTRITNNGRAKSFRVDALPVIVTDGSRLYFAEAANSGMRSTLNQASASGGDTSLVPTSFEQNIELGDISPNRSELLLQTFVAGEPEMPLWILPLGGVPRRVGDVSGRDATWSPNGLKIAYAKGHELFACKTDGTEIQKLVTARGPVRWPRWSLDGSVLRFTVGDPGGWTTIEEVSAIGGRPRALLPGWKGVPCCGSWTPDGEHYVFQSSFNSRTDIWALRERAGIFRKAGPAQLTAGPMDFRSPVSTIDGKRLLVIGEQRRGELVRLESKSGQFVPYAGGISAEDVDVSKDRQWVAYVSYPERILWRSRVDGSQRLQLSMPPMEVYLPRWSPDGKQIAFAAAVPGKPSRIHVVGADGGRPMQLTAENHYETDPNWSPDQKSLVFGDAPWLDGSAPGSAVIHILDLKTRKVSTLSGSEGLFSPHWSPDARYVLAMSLDTLRLMLFDFSIHKWTELLNGPAAYPNWSRDGSYVYFINPYVAEPAVYRIRMKDRKLEMVISLRRDRLGWNIAGKWMGLAEDDSPLVLRDTGSEEIYALEWQPR